MQHGSSEQRQLVRSCIEQGNEQHFDEILRAVTGSGALDYTRKEAEKAGQQAAGAIGAIPHSHFKDSLLQLCAFAVDRNH
jgi:octaprenyl-diphosphate synthase